MKVAIVNRPEAPETCARVAAKSPGLCGAVAALGTCAGSDEMSIHGLSPSGMSSRRHPRRPVVDVARNIIF